jgi:nicotinate-nucleotide pyrophosphorylase (carboxylating)
MTTINPLPAILVEPVVRAALLEDLGRAGDITTDAVVPPATVMEGAITTRAAGTIAGADAAVLAFRLLDPEIECQIERPDGTRVALGDVVVRAAGPARPILSAERVALNLLCHLSGVATATAALVDAVRPYRAGITCTRKTTPGLRALEKHAVRAGGGSNHRFGLDDAILIKDNHIAVAGGIRQAIERARDSVGHLVKIEVEVDTLAQLKTALAAGPDAVLLDNMTPDQLGDAVKLTNGRAVTEASGRVTLDTVSRIAASGVDLISVGRITHSAPSLDLGLDVRNRTAAV